MMAGVIRGAMDAWRRGLGGLTARQRTWIGVLVFGGTGLAVGAWVFFCARGIGWNDPRDFIHFYEAGRAARTGEDIYLAHWRGYIYPPLFAVLMVPLSLLGYSWAAVVWTCVSAAFMAAAAWLLAREVGDRFGLRMDAWARWVVACAATMAVADKTRAVLQHGQTDSLTVLLIAMGFASERRRPFWCGVCMGLACNIKYHTLVFLPYFIARGRWRECGGMLVGLCIGAVAGVPLWGWARNGDYLARSIAGVTDLVHLDAEGFGPRIAVHAMTWIQSVSVTSGLARIIDHQSRPVWFVAAVSAAACACLALGWWMYARAGRALFSGRWGAGERDGERAMTVALEWAGLLAATAVFSPQSTGRHFYLLVFVAAVAAPALLYPRYGIARWPIVAAWVVMFLGMTLPPATEGWSAEVAWWRGVGGLGWCALVYYFTVLWLTLRWIGAERATLRNAHA